MSDQDFRDMTYWKATQPDGTDFYTGTVDYAAALASGEPLPELSGDGEFPGPGWYHLATVPTECVGMSWPCRLFEVEPVGDQMADSEHPYKVGCSSVRVVREVDGHVALGPQGAEVVALISRASALTGDEVGRLGAAWDAALYAAARGAARGTALGAAWDAAWDAAGARVAAWGAAWDAARGAAGDAARVAARVAAGALVSRDLIGESPGWDQAAYDLLTGPWRQAIGPVHPGDGDSDE
jgi:hypothetical protein